MGDKNFLHKDYIKLCKKKVVYKSDAALAHFREIFSSYGLLDSATPLPTTREEFDALAWKVLDIQAAEIVEELNLNVPAKEKAAGRWSGSRIVPFILR